MITEDYVSFEVAKLLKEKGFDEKCRYVWKLDKANDPQDTDGISKLCAEQLIDGSFIDNSGINKAAEDEDWFEDYHKAYLCPTLQMAMKWLREVHNIETTIFMSALNSDNSREYMFNVFFTNERYLEPSKTKAGFKSYEEACEEGIRYCLINLI